MQSWTVIREHGDFITLRNALSGTIDGIPACPAAPAFDTACVSPSSSSSSQQQQDVHDIVKVRNAAQTWLSNILLFPGARESPAVRTFLCYGANFVPSHFQGVNWIPFTHNSSTSGSPDSTATSSHDESHTHHHHHRGGEEELEMDEMFVFGDGPAEDDHHDDEVGDYDEDDAVYFSATERYQPTEETVTQDDVMEFQNNADDVEMIEDVGSLAQSLGASHMGRSLQLQAQLAGGRPNFSSGVDASRTQPQQGLIIGGLASNHNMASTGVGGIGNAVAEAEAKVDGLSDSFFQKKPVSAPRLDSFKMIKVVGKGSFGKSSQYPRSKLKRPYLGIDSV